MERRQFLQLGIGSLFALSLPKFGMAHPLPLDLPTTLQDNPLLHFDGLPSFGAVEISHITPAIDFLLKHNKDVVKRVCAQKSITWDNFYTPIEDAQNKLDRVWGVVAHLHSVKNSDALRAVYQDITKSTSDYESWFGMYRPLYEGFKKLAKSDAFKTYTQAQQKAINDALLDFKLSGVALTGDKAERYTQVVARLSELSTQFSNNVLDADMGWELVIDDKAKLSGLSDIALQKAEQSAKSKDKTGYRFGLDVPSYLAITTYADDRELRKQMYEAYRTRASDKGQNAGKWDNTPIINELIDLRLELAQLLGYKNYAQYVLAKRMAKDTDEVLGFLKDLLAKTRPTAKKQMQDLQKYGRDIGVLGQDDKIEPWDFAYLSEKQKQALYDIDKEALRVYFPVDKVLNGMFEVTRRLFGVDVREKTGVSLPHPDTRFFELYQDGKHIASFYLDLFARENKRGGAWHSTAIGHFKKSTGDTQKPVSMLVCNFGGATGDKPALLLHSEVETLFHEFGHGLHHMLTQVDVLALSGTRVPRDAVEFPSQMLENWTWDKDVLALISAHYETGEPIAMDMVQKMQTAKNYLSATSIVRQLEYALFDFRLHVEHKQGDKKTLSRLRDDIRQNVSVLGEPDWVRMAHSFNHIFSGGYSAGYYSYLWSEVLASDAFTRFENEGLFNQQTGQDFINAILSQGGADEPMRLFERFMGRKPKNDALLKARGIA
ncbi:Oligopeptidase A [Moraxella caprae]|uniref:oligopeptidase A n=1 Tax=Moraxella caprae TaxID=90240 RepID=A0A378R2F6_9GAMM|nr:M3 family metallopeptidase [Moraxella caprae]STZ09523.1 Oligopeptidase A [Moraxella caprae]